MSGGTALVVAKAPVPGLAKTRLAAVLGDAAAADVAAAALLDTLDAVADAAFDTRVVAITGELDSACRSTEIAQRLNDFHVIPQRGATFAQRLAHAHADAAEAGTGPVLQIGMDTPQITADLLGRCAARMREAPAVLGMARDGGWWVLGVTDPSIARCLVDVPMSHPHTGALTLAALERAGAGVAMAEELADVDTVDDIRAVRAACRSGSRFARATGGFG